MKVKCLIISIVVSVFLISCSKEPTNFEDCILQNMKNADTKLAANSIYAACSDKFSPEKIAEEKAIELTQDQRHKIDGRGTVSQNGSYYHISIYNGNEDISISELDIVIIDNTTKNEKIYKIKKIIKPLEATDISFSIMPIGNDHSWGVEQGKGFK